METIETAPASRRTVFVGAGWLAMCKAGSQVFSWIGTFYVASRLLPTDYGLSNLSTAFTEFAVILTNLGIGTTLVQKQEVDRDKVNNLFTATLILGLLLALSALGLSYFGAWYFRNPALIPLTQFTALIYLLSSLTIVPYNFLNRDMRFKERGLLDMYSVFASILTQIILAYLGFGVWTLLWGSAVRFFTRLSFAFYYSGYRPGFNWNWSLLKQDLGFSARLTFNWLLSVLKDRSLMVIIGRAYTVTELGLLGFAGTLSGIPNLKMVQLLREVLLPLLSKRAGSPASQMQGLATALKVMTLVIMPVYLCGFYYGSDILAHILPQKWASMFPIFQVLCLVQLWNVLASVVSIYNTAQGRPGRSTWFELTMALVILPASFAFRSLDLVHLAHLWSAIGGTVFVGWFWLLFRKETAFLRRYAGLTALVTLICTAIFLLDTFASRYLGLTNAAWIAALRTVFFILCYGGFLRATQWHFLKSLRKK